MSLQEMLTGVQHLSDSVLVLKLSNDFAVGCEIIPDDGRKDARFTLLDNIHGSNPLFGKLPIPSGDNANWVSTGEYTSLSHTAHSMLEEYMKDMIDPLSSTSAQLKEAYEEILKPVHIEPVLKRDWRVALGTIGFTVTYPISLPLLTLKHWIKGERDIDGIPMWDALAITPRYFPSAVKELIYSSPKGVRITNKEVLLPKAEDETYVGIKAFLDYAFNPDFFGDFSIVEDKYGHLDVVFPNGLELSKHACYYSHTGNSYSQAKYFLKIDTALKDKVYTLRVQEESVYHSLHTFRDQHIANEVGVVLKGLGVV